VMKYLAVIGATLLSAFGGYYLKIASNNKGIWNLIKCKYLWIGGFLYVASTGFTIYLLQIVEYSIAVPLGSLTYVWSFFIAKHMLGENITKKRIIGMICIVIGVIIIAFK